MATRGAGFATIETHDSHCKRNVALCTSSATACARTKPVAKGSKHNRGCAIDLSIYDLKTGKPVEMPSDYDEFTERASPDYAGGTPEQRANRDLLRRLMEDEGFIVNDNEWWHFDYKDWEKYAIYDISFADAAKLK